MRTLLAKAVYSVGGVLWTIKRPQRVYSMTWDDGDDTPKSTPEGWRWLGLNSCFTLLGWAERIDREHYSHWAYVEPVDDYDYPACQSCKGWIDIRGYDAA